MAGVPVGAGVNLRRGERAVDWFYPSPGERQAYVVVIASAAKQSRATRTVPGLLRRRCAAPRNDVSLQPPGHVDGDAGDEVGVGGGEEGDHARLVGSLGDAAQGRARYLGRLLLG